MQEFELISMLEVDMHQQGGKAGAVVDRLQAGVDTLLEEAVVGSPLGVVGSQMGAGRLAAGTLVAGKLVVGVEGSCSLQVLKQLEERQSW